MILHFSPFLGNMNFFIMQFFSEFMYPLKIYFKDIKSVASNQDGLLINKSRFQVCLKTRRVTKLDALVLSTLWYANFWPKIYLILYPSLENSTTHITIVHIFESAFISTYYVYECLHSSFLQDGHISIRHDRTGMKPKSNSPWSFASLAKKLPL